MTTTQEPTDLSVVLTVSDRSAEEQFWKATHTSLYLAHRKSRAPISTHDEKIELAKKESLVAVVGCQDGTIWLLDVGMPSSRETSQRPPPSPKIRVSDADSIISTRNGTGGYNSPMLSRTSSSSYLNGIALSPPSVSKGELSGLGTGDQLSLINTNTGNRHRAVSSTSSTGAAVKPSAYNLGNLLPSSTSNPFRNRSTTNPIATTATTTTSTATARLTSISAADDKALRIRLKDVNTSSHSNVSNEPWNKEGLTGGEHVGGFTRLAGETRGGLEDLHGKHEGSIAGLRIKLPRRTDSEIVADEKLDIQVNEAIHEEQELTKLREVLEDEKACRDCESPELSVTRDAKSQPRFEVLCNLLPTGWKGSKIVDVKGYKGNSNLVVCLSERGMCSILDLETLLFHSVLNVETSSREKKLDNSRPDLTPPSRWKELLSFSHDKDNYFLAYAYSPTDSDMDQAKDLTNVVLLSENSETGTLNWIGSNSLPGEGPVQITQSAGSLIMLHLSEGGLERYSVQVTPLVEQPRTSRSQVDLKAFFTPLPTRPHSRSGLTQAEASKHKLSKEDAPASDFGKMLGKRLLGRPGAKTPEEKVENIFLLSPASSIQLEGLLKWQGLQIWGDKGVGYSEDVLQCFTIDSKGFRLKGGNIDLPSNVSSLSRMTPTTCFVTTTTSESFVVDITIGQRQEGYDVPLIEGSILSGEREGNLVVIGDSIHLATSLSKAQFLSWSKLGHRIMSDDAEMGSITQILPFRKQLLVGSSGGKLCVKSFMDVLERNNAQEKLVEEDPEAFESDITCLQLVSTSEVHGDLVFVGYEDGSVRVWSADTLDLVTSLSASAAPIKRILVTDYEKSKQLKNKVLFISEDGDITVFGLSEMRSLYMIPAFSYPLERAILQKDDLILTASHGRARVWNLESGEFRRSTSIDAATDMLVKGEWIELAMTDHAVAGIDPVDQGPSVETKLNQWNESLLKPQEYFNAVHTPKLSDSIDAVCHSKLHLSPNIQKIGFGLKFSLGEARYWQEGKAAWAIGPLQTLSRQICLIASLHHMDHGDQMDREEPSHEVIAFYSATLPAVIGHDFQDVPIDLLLSWYNSGDSSIRHAVRLLLETRLARMNDQDLMHLADIQIGHLPVNVAASVKQSPKSLKSLIVLGTIALSKYALLKPVALKDLACSMLYILKEGSLYGRTAAIDFAMKGFEVWQAYVDPSDLLRALFDLAVVKDDDPKAGQAIMTQARTAVLQLAASAGALFISTVTMDIVTAETIPRRNAIMKLCVFIARKKPIVLLPSLPRLAEAVVKSLDPTRVRMRESIQQTATVILNELVSTFPSIDFAGKVQKLAVGTQEGAVIMYDLKTATRLYVLETHNHPVSALSFSPDGRRLATASLLERKVTIWKVGSSFSGFLNVGGPPRQGSGSGEPFKSLDFFVAQPGKEIDLATGQQKISFTWPGERHACLEIGQMKLTFAT